MNFWVQLLVLVVTNLIAQAIAPKIKTKAATLEDFEIPRAEMGAPIPVIFGSVTITGPTVAYYGNLRVHTQTTDGVKTRRYYMTLHFVWCHGPVDALTEILVGERSAWRETEVTSSGAITIDADELFGGREKEGGIAGTFDVMMGEATQTANAHLVSILGSPQPGHRGVAGGVLQQGLISANTPYVKPFAFKLRRILEGWRDDTAWYSGKATIASTSPGAAYDEYVETLNLDYWWKCEFTTSGDEDVNVGSETAVLQKPAGQTYIAAEYAALTENTFPALDSVSSCVSILTPHSVRFTSSNTGTKRLQFNAGDIAAPFTAGVWLEPATTGQRYGIFQTSYATGVNGYYGMWCRATVDNRLEVAFGNGLNVTAANRRSFFSTEAILPASGAYFFAIYCNATTSSATIDFTVYINGEAFTKAGAFTHDGVSSATTFDWGEDLSCHFGRYNGYWGQIEFIGVMDEPFFHYGDLTQPVIAQMYALGSEPLGSASGAFMNPAHIIYEAITNLAWGMGYPTTMIDTTSFEYAADIFSSECLGLCLIWTQQQTIEEFIQIVCDHAGAILGVDPSTGKFTLTPIRFDYSPASLDVYDESSIMLDKFERVGYGELIGELNVVFRNWETNKDETVTVQNAATIQSQSGLVSDTTAYPGIPTADLARRIAMRDLKARSVPLARGTMTVNRIAWDLVPGAVFKLSWTKLGLVEVICRVTGIDTGTLADGKIIVHFAEDVFGLPSSTYAADQDSGSTEPDLDPVAAAYQTALELPYWWLDETLEAYELSIIDADAGYGLALGISAIAVSDRYELWASVNAGSYALEHSDADWTASALLSAAVTRDATSLSLSSSTLMGTPAGRLLQIGTGASAEIVRISSGDLETTVTVDRGMLDTTPAEHASSTRVWLLPSPILHDETQYTATDAVSYKLLTGTDSGVLDIADAVATSVTMDSRMIRPIPPGNVRIGVEEETFPAIVVGPLYVQWSHRNRPLHTDTVTQSATGISTEASVTYSVYLIDDSDDSSIESSTGLTGTSLSIDPDFTGRMRLEIASVRAGYESWQRQVRVFEYLSSGRITEDGEERITEDGERRSSEG